VVYQFAIIKSGGYLLLRGVTGGTSYIIHFIL
jgi:hypothetical protein